MGIPESDSAVEAKVWIVNSGAPFHALRWWSQSPNILESVLRSPSLWKLLHLAMLVVSGHSKQATDSDVLDLLTFGLVGFRSYLRT